MIALSPETHQAIRDYTLANYPNEMCGLLMKDGSFTPCPNIAEDPTKEFTIDPDLFLEIEKRGIVALIHSHVKPPEVRLPHDPRRPSHADMVAQINSDLPWGIVATEGESVSDFLWFGTEEREPLEGRDFVSGVFDCYSLVRDWYKLERGIDLPNYPREDAWWDEGGDLLLQQYADAGFVDGSLDELEVGDGILFSILANKTNHCGVYIGNGELLHHLTNRLSRVELLMKWNNHITKVLKYAPKSNLARKTRKVRRS